MAIYRVTGDAPFLSESNEMAAGEPAFEITVNLAIVGGGGCGLAAALAARDGGVSALVLERDARTAGSTDMSTGLIPGAASRLQLASGVVDSADIFAADIMRKAKGQTDEGVVRALAQESGATIDWLTERHHVPLSFVDTFLYPGHSRMRMHGTPNRTGSELMTAMSQAAAAAGADVLTNSLVTELYADEQSCIHGIRVEHPDGTAEDIGCGALVLACSGFGGNRAMVAEFIPEIADAEFYGHTGNQGDALRWGRSLGAAIRDEHAYQGHGGLAAGHRIPILWPVIINGGFQINRKGRRFSNESLGYSEQAVKVVAQPGHFAWDIYDERIDWLMQEFQDYRDAMEARAIVSATSVEDLASKLSVPLEGLASTLSEVAALVESKQPCPFGRIFENDAPLSPPYYAVKVNGALFHTQGGLAVDCKGRVLRLDGGPFPNLFAGGGAARGVSGPGSDGYIAGNGLLTAITLGRLAGEQAALQLQHHAAHEAA
jgi:fumarate reductase flavoprotein subunit